MRRVVIACLMGLLMQGSLAICNGEEQSLRSKIGEMLIVGFHGDRFEESSEVAEAIGKYHVGGVILFGRNIASPEALSELTEKLHNHSKISRRNDEGNLFIGIDQEGGMVNRLLAKNGFVEENVSAKELGEINNASFTYGYAEGLGKYLKAFGINLNFAPVVDLSVNYDNFIYKKERTFSKDVNIVYEQGNAFAQGMHKSGIVTALKHFPGHGSSAGDTHKGMVDVTPTWDVKELEPYREFIHKGYKDMIMISHVVNGKLDSSEVKNKVGEMGLVPATFSREMVTELLREEMGFQGVLVSDDLCMGAIANEYNFEDTLKYAINSGIDMLILANHQKDKTREAVEIIEGLVASGEIELERIEEAYQRIIELKRVKNQCFIN